MATSTPEDDEELMADGGVEIPPGETRTVEVHVSQVGQHQVQHQYSVEGPTIARWEDGMIMENSDSETLYGPFDTEAEALKAMEDS